MKKFLAVALTCTMLFGFSAAASAQGFDAGVKLGYNTLTGDNGDAFDGAFSGGLYGMYHFTPNIALQGSWLYHKHDNSDDLQAAGDFLFSLGLGTPTLSDIRLTVNEFDLNGYYFFPLEAPVRPYILGGVGLYYSKIDFKAIQGAFSADTDDSFWDFGLNIGGGLDFAVTERVKIGGEIIYTYVFDELDGGFFNFLATIGYGFTTSGY
jgi:opacity protein-like surface antigen